MSGFDAGRVFSTQAVSQPHERQPPNAPVQNETALFEFIQHFRLGAEYLYRDRLRSNLLVKQYVLEVQLEHVQMWSPALAQALRETPAEILTLVRLYLSHLLVRGSCQARSSSYSISSYSRRRKARGARLPGYPAIRRQLDGYA